MVAGQYAGPPSAEDDDIDVLAHRWAATGHVRVAEVECLRRLVCGGVLLLAVGAKSGDPALLRYLSLNAGMSTSSAAGT